MSCQPSARPLLLPLCIVQIEVPMPMQLCCVDVKHMNYIKQFACLETALCIVLFVRTTHILLVCHS